jgi:precorrin-2 dehydrogenase/sirohydrochlorin ferrochelatase
VEAVVLPIVLNTDIKVGLAGQGEALKRRRALLDGAQVPVRTVASKDQISGLQVLFIAGLDADASAELAGAARARGILVNVEDVPALCDFHVPAIVRRGDLMLTASTGGKAPGLSRNVREWLETRFGPEWDEHLECLSAARKDWRSQGLNPAEVSQRTRDFIAKEGWL